MSLQSPVSRLQSRSGGFWLVTGDWRLFIGALEVLQ